MSGFRRAVVNSPRCCPLLICGRKAQLGQKALGESWRNGGRAPDEGAPAGEGSLAAFRKRPAPGGGLWGEA